VDEFGAGLERQAGYVPRGEGIEQLTAGLDLLGHRGLREQALDLRGDPHVGRRARIEAAHGLSLVVGLQGWRERVAQRLERVPPRVTEHPNRYSHIASSSRSRLSHRPRARCRCRRAVVGGPARVGSARWLGI
jgi:hypothetical protein